MRSFFISLMLMVSFMVSTKIAHAEEWLKVEIKEINLSSERILEDCFNIINKKKYSGLLISIDSPGGSVDSVRNIIKSILESDVPVVSWVNPRGGRAASAGSFIVVASHIGAMSEGTSIGAATPILATGSNIDKDLKKKVENDLLSFMEDVTKLRGKDFTMVKSFILLATSITSKEALEHNVIDMVVSSEEELFNNLYGKTIKVKKDVEFSFTDKTPKIIEYKTNISQKLLSIISNPNLFYLLFLAGIIGIAVELTHPGVVFPGVMGGICLVSAFIAMSVVPVSFGAILLILLGICFMVAEAFLPSFGILGIGGVISFILGSIFLIPANSSNLKVAWYVIAPTTLAVLIFSLGIGYLVLKTLRRKRNSAQDLMVSKTGVVSKYLQEEDKYLVIVDGEIWNARVDGDSGSKGGEDIDRLKEHDKVKIKKVEGLELIIEKINNI